MVALGCVAVGHGEGLLLAVEHGGVGVVGGVDLEAVDVGACAGVGEVVVVLYLEEELRDLGGVDEVDLRIGVRLVGVEVIVETLRCGSEGCRAGTCGLGGDDGRGACRLLDKVATEVAEFGRQNLHCGRRCPWCSWGHGRCDRGGRYST